MVYDTQTNKVILFGGDGNNGNELNDTWAYTPPEAMATSQAPTSQTSASNWENSDLIEVANKIFQQNPQAEVFLPTQLPAGWYLASADEFGPGEPGTIEATLSRVLVTSIRLPSLITRAGGSVLMSACNRAEPESPGGTQNSPLPSKATPGLLCHPRRVET